MRRWQKLALCLVLSLVLPGFVFANSAILSWDANSAQENIVGYRAFYMTNVLTGSPANTDAIAVEMGPAFQGATSAQRTFTITGLQLGRHYFAVTAYDGTFAESGFSNVVFKDVVQDTTLPGDVTNVTATPGNAMIRLQWRNPSDSDLAGVKILYRTDRFPSSNTDGTELAKVRAVPGTVQSFDFTGLVNGQTYYFSLHAYDTSGNMRNTSFARGIPRAHFSSLPPPPPNHSSKSEASTGGGCSMAGPVSRNDRGGTIVSFIGVPLALFFARMYRRVRNTRKK